MRLRVQLAIIGGGPSGLLLAQLCANAGIECAVIERQSRDYVLKRIRAGVLEWGTVELLRSAGLGSRMDAQGQVHEGFYLAAQNQTFRVDLKKAISKQVMVYGQTEVTKDLYDAHSKRGTSIYENVTDVAFHDLTTKPYVTFTQDKELWRVDADFIAGCDGFHGVSRHSIPADVRREYEKVYPFGWLGILSPTKPVSHELIYANHPRGFALASMRNPQLSRYYIQVPLEDKVEAWSDAAFWDEFKRRLPAVAAERLVTDTPIEKSIAPLRSFVSEPMRWGKLFLCGDAAHIVPPTGAKGLNLAVSDVYYLSEALRQHFKEKSDAGLEAYSAKALARVWKAIRFSWWMTTLLHRFPVMCDFDQRVQESEIDYIAQSPAAQMMLAENYCGLPL